MTKTTSFKVNSPEVVQETIDGEVVIVNLKKGDYYSLVKAGADIWNGVESGISEEKIVENILELYSGDRTEIENSVSALLKQLEQEEIIIPNQTENETVSNEQPKINEGGEKLPFEPPTLGKYTDMEELLALDPIHEVDEMGWPNAKV